MARMLVWKAATEAASLRDSLTSKLSSPAASEILLSAASLEVLLAKVNCLADSPVELGFWSSIQPRAVTWPSRPTQFMS